MTEKKESINFDEVNKDGTFKYTGIKGNIDNVIDIFIKEAMEFPYKDEIPFLIEQLEICRKLGHIPQWLMINIYFPPAKVKNFEESDYTEKEIADSITFLLPKL